MALRVKTRPLPSKPTRKRIISSSPKKNRIRQDDAVKLTREDKKALEEIMTGKTEVKRYSGEEYLKKLANDK